MKNFKRILIQIVLLSVTLLFVGCGGGGSGETATSAGTQSTESTLSSISDATSDGGSDATDTTGDDSDTSDNEAPLFLLTEVRSMDGTDNNFANLGAAVDRFGEDTSRAYGDGVNSPSGEDRPNARLVSNLVVDQDEETPDPGGRTAFLWVWGQFLDHDFTLIHEIDSEEFSILVPTGDVYFDPFGTGTETIPFFRALYDATSGTSIDNPRAQLNHNTSFIDASMVYGSDAERADALRSHIDGKLLTSANDLPPFNDAGLENAGGTSSTLYVCGDIRANENILLLAMHTIFIREHNRIADDLKAQFPELTDEELYQGARKRVGAIIQAITYNEYLPALLGEDALEPYDGYDGSVDPRIGVLFATAVYRMGHSQVSPTVQRLDANYNETAEGNLNLADAFFNSSELAVTGVEPLLRGASREAAQRTDSQIIDELRNLLFGAPGSGGLDLAALNLQRGRDHGLPDYNTVRRENGLTEVTDANEITTDAERQQAIRDAYPNVDTIDPWVGFLSEDAVGDGIVGPTLRLLLIKQFQNLRDGDRFFYLNDPDLAAERDQLSATTLKEVIERNTDITNLPTNIFFDASTQTTATPRRQRELQLRTRSLF